MQGAPCIWVTKIFVSFDILTLLSSENGCCANCRTVPSAQSTTACVVSNVPRRDVAEDALHNALPPRASRTRLEQLRVSVGPPPLVVPKKVTVIRCAIFVGLWGEEELAVRATGRKVAVRRRKLVRADIRSDTSNEVSAEVDMVARMARVR